MFKKKPEEKKQQNERSSHLCVWVCILQINGTTNYDVKHIMETWTIQDGFPFVNISLETSGTETTVSASQKRFMSSPGVAVDLSASPLG